MDVFRMFRHTFPTPYTPLIPAAKKWVWKLARKVKLRSGVARHGKDCWKRISLVPYAGHPTQLKKTPIVCTSCVDARPGFVLLLPYIYIKLDLRSSWHVDGQTVKVTTKKLISRCSYIFLARDVLLLAKSLQFHQGSIGLQTITILQQCCENHYISACSSYIRWQEAVAFPPYPRTDFRKKISKCIAANNPIGRSVYRSTSK